MAGAFQPEIQHIDDIAHGLAPLVQLVGLGFHLRQSSLHVSDGFHISIKLSYAYDDARLESFQIPRIGFEYREVIFLRSKRTLGLNHLPQASQHRKRCSPSAPA